MWNRVVLLSCGMVVGWGLANYWSCAPADMPRHRYRVRLALAVALGLSVWIGSDDVSSGFAAMLIVALSALVAYAARARQIASLAGGAPAPAPGDREQVSRPAVVVVTHALPEAYTGPEYWAACLHRQSVSAHKRPNWFTAPLTVRRIRSAYLQMGSAPASYLALAGLVNRLRAQLPPEVVMLSAHPYAAPSLDSQLSVLAARAASLILIAPIDLEESDRDDLSRQIAGSSTERRGVRVELLPRVRFGVWGQERANRDLEALVRETVPSSTANLPLDGVDTLAASLGARLSQAALTDNGGASPREPASPEMPS
jgi:hypothetical protein